MVGFRGRIFATPPTVAVMQHALLDFQRRFASEGEAPLYSEEDLRRCLDRIETVDVHQKIEVRRMACSSHGFAGPRPPGLPRGLLTASPRASAALHRHCMLTQT